MLQVSKRRVFALCMQLRINGLSCPIQLFFFTKTTVFVLPLKGDS